MERVRVPKGTLRFPILLLNVVMLFPLLAWAPGRVLGQTPSSRIHEFLESASGFQLLGTIHTGSLGAGETLKITASLLEGSDYMVVGYCDRECSNLDLSLFGPDSILAQADRLPDSEPVLTFTPETSGRFHIQVDMVGCSRGHCDLAVGVLGSSEEPGVIPGEDMAGRLTLLGAEVTSMGFTEVGEELRGALITDQTQIRSLSLLEEVNYRVIGVCDKDCYDLDLALLDPSGKQVTGDFLEDDLPVLAFSPDTTAEFQLEVIMVACAVEPCAYRVATYAMGEAVGPGGATLSGELLHHDTHHGKLAPDDEVLESGAYQDLYRIEAKPGQRIIVDLRSDDFDTLLRVSAPDGEIEENDDFGNETGHSHIEILAIVEGTFTIHVTSFEPESTGAYVLQIAVVS
jgi:hypothetical protein